MNTLESGGYSSRSARHKVPFEDRDPLYLNEEFRVAPISEHGVVKRGLLKKKQVVSDEEIGSLSREDWLRTDIFRDQDVIERRKLRGSIWAIGRHFDNGTSTVRHEQLGVEMPGEWEIVDNRKL